MTDHAIARLSALTDHAAYQNYGPDLLMQDVETVLTALHAAQARAEGAERDNAGLLAILRELDYSDPAQAERILADVRDQPHPGRALMAGVLADLTAARAVVEAARRWLEHETDLLPVEKGDIKATGAVLDAVLGYDRAARHGRAGE